MSFIGLRKPPEQPVAPALGPGGSAPFLDAMLPDKNGYLVAFIRHVGCPFAEKTVRQLRRLSKSHPELQFIVVSHGDPQTTRRWLTAIGGAAGLTLVIDESRKHYGAYGLGYSGPGHFLGPATWLGLLAALGRGMRNRVASGTRWQPSATFLLDASRTVLWRHVARNAADVPALGPLLERFSAALAVDESMQGFEGPGAIRVQILEHCPFEKRGNIDRWLVWRDARVETTRFYRSDWALPEPADCDLIIVLGGPMSVNDEQRYPWLVEEKAFLRAAIKADVAVVGICLGAQLIASALGAKVRPAEQPEIGWFDIHGTAATSGCFRFPRRLPVLHWHGETCELPPGAILLADSSACAHQAFQVGTRVLGLQFHPEATPGSLEAMLEQEGDSLEEGPFVQSESSLRHVPEAYYRNCARLMSAILSYVTRQPLATTAEYGSGR